MSSTILVSGNPLADRAAEEIRSLGCTVVRGPVVTDWSRDLVLPEDRWEEVLPTVDVMVVTPHDSCPGPMLEAAPRLRGVVSLVIGVETIDVEVAHERGLIIANGAVEENYLGLAEATVTLLVSSLLRIPAKQRLLHEGRRLRSDRMLGTTVRGKTVGLIGFGRTARAVVQRLQGWGVEVLAFDPYIDAAQVSADVEFVELPDLLAGSDVVSVHVTLSEETRHLLGETEFEQMRRGAYLVNTARGGVLDEAALGRALASGRLGGAALDVFEVEPLPDDSPLRELEDVILTPHMAGHTEELQAALPIAARENVARILQGQRPLYTVSPPALVEAWQERRAGGRAPAPSSATGQPS